MIQYYNEGAEMNDRWKSVEKLLKKDDDTTIVPEWGHYEVIQGKVRYISDDKPEAVCPVQKEIEELLENRKKPHVCKHEWEFYTGLNEEFEFCRICDKKRS